jgi:hypothetical protein
MSGAWLVRGFANDKDLLVLLARVNPICINQKNDDEKAHQIQMMGDIYRNAAQVLIWLGESTDFSEEGMKVIVLLTEDFMQWYLLANTARERWVQRQQSPTALGGDQSAGRLLDVFQERHHLTTDRDVIDFGIQQAHMRLDVLSRSPDKRLIDEGILGILSRPWFERVWVIQECVLARKAWVVCGKDVLPFQYFRLLHTILFSVAQSLTSEGGSHWNTSLNTHLFGMIHRARAVFTPWQNKRYGLLTMLEDIYTRGNEMKATDPRDRIYGLFSLNPGAAELNIPVDYKISWQKLYEKVTRELLAQHGIRVLSLIGTKGRDLDGSLPSWVLDWPGAIRLSLGILPDEEDIANSQTYSVSRDTLVRTSGRPQIMTASFP